MSKPLLVLVADDDEDVLGLVRLLLTRPGYLTVVARDGAEALAAAREWIPDLALLDVTMPVMDGYAVTRELRRDPATKHIPVILLTARTQPADRAEGLEAGASLYITKPFSPQELHNSVTAVLGRSQEPGD